MAAKGNKNALGNEGGRPSLYKPEYIEQVFKLCLLGATDKDIADFFDVHIDTLYEWRKKHPEFSEAVKKGKLEADINISESLYNKAKGYKVNTKKAFKLRDQESMSRYTERLEIVDCEEVVPADTTAAIFWLKNRQRDKWRDKQDLDVTTNGKDITGLDYSKLSIEALKEIDALSSHGGDKT